MNQNAWNKMQLRQIASYLQLWKTQVSTYIYLDIYRNISFVRDGDRESIGYCQTNKLCMETRISIPFTVWLPLAKMYPLDHPSRYPNVIYSKTNRNIRWLDIDFPNVV